MYCERSGRRPSFWHPSTLHHHVLTREMMQDWASYMSRNQEITWGSKSNRVTPWSLCLIVEWLRKTCNLRGCYTGWSHTVSCYYTVTEGGRVSHVWAVAHTACVCHNQVGTVRVIQRSSDFCGMLHSLIIHSLG